MAFVSVVERKVCARGAWWKDFSFVDLSSIEFADSLVQLEQLNYISGGKISDSPLLFYPGCGCDIVFPLEYVQRLWPRLKTISCVFVDVVNQQGLIETVLDTLNISFARKENVLVFYWANILVRLRIVTCDVFSFVDSFSGYDIYFERAFRIMKDGHDGYEEKIVRSLNMNGMIISDNGFLGFDSRLDYVLVAPELSVYGEMVIGRKKSAKEDTNF